MPWATNSGPNEATGEAFVELEAANGALSVGAKNTAVDGYILFPLASLNKIQSRQKCLPGLSRSCAEEMDLVKALDDDVVDELMNELAEPVEGGIVSDDEEMPSHTAHSSYTTLY